MEIFRSRSLSGCDVLREFCYDSITTHSKEGGAKEAVMKSGRQIIDVRLLCHHYGSTYCSGHLRKRIASKESAGGHHSLTHLEISLPSFNPELALADLPSSGAAGNIADPVLL